MPFGVIKKEEPMEPQKEKKKPIAETSMENHAEKTLSEKKPLEKPIEISDQISIDQGSATLQGSINPPLDAIRGVYYFATLIGDKKASKAQLEAKLKTMLLTPKGFGEFMENIAKYLKQIQ